VIVITSRDSAILLLYRCLRHSHTERELRTIFHHLNFLKSDRKSQIALFEKFLTNENFFLTHLLYAKSTLNSDRELYKKRWCDQMRTWFSFHWKNRFIIWLSQIVAAKTSCWKREKIATRFLEQRETEQICLWLMILSNRQLSFDR
jgi:hypothetical protein